jgi:carbonic anhydrase/acetyltransferase-like protein (isoleucine patch superfamily)
MPAALLLYDALTWLVATLLYGTAFAIAWAVGRHFAVLVPWPVAIFPATLVGVVALIAMIALLTAALPRLREGVHPMMRGHFFVWVARSLLRRLLFFGPLKELLFNSSILRFLALRALGARVAFSANMSNDVTLLDPALLVVGPGATIGARALVAGHFVKGGRLVLGRVEIGKGSLVSADVVLGPGVRIGEKVTIEARAALSMNVKVEDGAHIGRWASLDTGCVVEAGARVSAVEYVAPKRRVERPPA